VQIVNDIALSLGSNIGDRLANLSLAIDLLRSSEIISHVLTSSIYETEPIGESNQANFLNLCLTCKTKHNEMELLGFLKSVEHYVGRQKRKRWHEREIDIDILFFSDLVIRSQHLVIPHERMHERKFVLAPLVEILPNFNHPVLGVTVQKLLENCKDKSQVKVYKGIF